MHVYLILLRILHVGFGVFWAGTMFFAVGMLLPSVGDMGPDGGKMIKALADRHFLEIVPGAALLTILSGLLLFWRDSAGLQPVWMRSGTGIALSTGALAALIAFVLGIAVMRPAIRRNLALAAAEAQAPSEDPARPERMATMQRLRQRAGVAGRWVAFLLGITVVCMAVARYV